MRLSRRAVLATAGVLALPGVLRAQAKPRVVVVGGGAGGATAAKHLAKLSQGGLDVTLVSGGERFATCFFSNHVIAGLRDMASITQTYDAVAGYGVRVLPERATAIDRERREVRVGDTALAYDRLVLSPGIDIRYDSIEGYSEAASEIAPHAWQAGRQTEILIAKLAQLHDGDTVLIVAPPNPYRCPPGPYERASVIAHVLKAKGFSKSRIIILDHKDKFSKQSLFEAGWAKHYPGMIEWYGPPVIGAIKSLDAAAGKIATEFDTFSGALLNVIPAQRAGAIAFDAGLADASGYCSIDPVDFRSQADPAIHVIGDASIAGEMPKSAFSANRQAHLVASSIAADLLALKTELQALANTCWSMLEIGDSVKIGASYKVTNGAIVATDPFISTVAETRDQRRQAFNESQQWYEDIVEDAFR